MIKSRIFTAALIMSLLPAVSLADTLYDYGTGGLSISGSGDWTGAGSGSNALLLSSTTDDAIKVENIRWNDGGNAWYGFVWNAEAGQTIKSVTFTYDSYNFQQYPALFAEQAAITSSTYDGQFSSVADLQGLADWYDGAGADGATTVTFEQAEGITSIALGLFEAASMVGEGVQFSNVSIVTVPEPTTIGLIALGGVALIRRRRK